MRKFKQLLTAFGVVSLGFLSSCAGIVSSNGNKDTGDGQQNLNAEQLDLIASLTENEKYFNSNYVSTISGLQSEDKVHLIITMEKESLSDLYENSKKDEYDSLTDFASSEEGIKYSNSLISEQKSLIKRLQDQHLIEGVTHQYTTLLNGFGVETTYGTVTNIEKTKNVYDVSVSEAYALPQTVSGNKQDVTTNVVDVYDTGIFNSSDVPFDGSNTVVAILDSGFDTHHSVFQNIPAEDTQLFKRSDIEKVIDESVAAQLTPGLKASDVYINGKIPFAYDYADHDPVVDPLSSEHGTHVGGIIAGKDDTITGVATNAQLVLMKVFSDFKEGANTDDILAGLEDSVLLGVDAINMSLGTSCGFTRPTDEDYLNKVYDSIEKAGISLVVAASNSYSAGFNTAGGNTNKVTTPDAGTVGSPSTYEGALSVASISGVKSNYIVSDEGYVFYYIESNNSTGVAYNFADMLDLPQTGSKTIEYVTVPGAGLNINYSTIDVKGKIALVRRGTNSFEDKARIAAEHGAIGAILYNNVSGEISMSAGNNLAIPFCSISQDDGEVLAKKSSGSLTFSREQQAGPFMSNFSSWGPTPDLKLKPEITAHGGNILSAIPGNKYNTLSGTSMASPNMCGAIVLIRQYVKQKFPEFKPTEVNALSMQLLMSTATIALDQYGNPYSPRKQGAGLASLKEATTTQGYITVDGTDRSKLEIGDDPNETGVYKLKYNIVNMSSTDSLSYKISNETMTESVSTYDSRYVAEHANMLNPSQSVELLSDVGTLEGDVVTVPANSVVTIEQTLTLSAEEKRSIKELFPNGMYIEGFTCLKDNTEAKIDLNAPYLGFFGDWTKAPIFDKTFYEVESTAHNQAIDDEDKIKADYYATTPYGTYFSNYIIPLGSYVYDIPSGYDAIPASEEHAAISTSSTSINGITTIYAGLMRGGKEVITKITDDATGEVIYYHVNHDQIRAYNGYPSTDLLNILATEVGLKNNSTYTVSMEAKLDYGDGGVNTNLNNTFSFKFTADNEAPIIKNVKYESEYDRSLRDYRYYLTVEVYDNHYAMDIRPFILQAGSLVDLSSTPIPVYGTEKGTTSSVRFEITDYLPSLANGSGANGLALTNGIGIMVEDYAMNSNYYFVNLPGTDIDSKGSINFVNSEGLALQSISGKVGETIDLTQYINSSSENFKNLNEAEKQKYMSSLAWSSSNESVAIIKGGQVDCLSAGTSTITASFVTTDGYVARATLRLIVTRNSNKILKAATTLKDIQFTYFDTEFAFPRGGQTANIGTTGSSNYVSSYTGAISMYPGEKIYMHYEITPWNLQGYELTWSTSNPNVLSVDQDGHVVALKEGSATLTLRVSIDGVQSSILASKRIVVNSPFVVENGKLVAYKGIGDENGVVEIPERLNLTEISDYAFASYTTDMSIIVNEDDWDANKIPAGNEFITKVIIPYSVNTIGKYAFYNCSNLQEVEFKVNPNATPTSNQNITTINQYAFQKCTSLKKANIGTVSIINKAAFDGCVALEEADLSNIYALAENAFRNCTSLKTVDITTLRNAGTGAFENCTSLKSFTSGEYTKLSKNMFKGSGLEDVTIYTDRIPEGCFEDCTSLKKVTVENDLIFVGQYAFKNNTSLSSVTFKGGVEYFDNEAFADCLSLTTFTLPSSNITLEDDVFSGCTNLDKLVLASKTFIEKIGTSVVPNTVSSFEVATDNINYKTNISNNVLVSADGKTIYLVAPNSNITSFDFATEFPGLETISSGAFSAIKGLTSIDLSNVLTLKTIGNNAFEKVADLTSVKLPEGLLTIGKNAFKNTSISEIVLPTTLKEIGDNAFSGTSITDFVLPNGVKVGADVLAGTRLVSLTIGQDVTLGTDAFRNLTSLTKVSFVGSGNVVVGDNSFAGCTSLSSFNFKFLAGRVGNGAFSGDYSLTTIDLENVEEIGDNAFASISNSNMRVTLGNKLTSIGSQAFYGSRMNEITIPSNVSYVGNSAFENCARLRTVTNLSSILSSLPTSCFANCTSLTTVSLGEKVTSIGDSAFSGDSSLVTVNATNITNIGSEAFKNTTKLSSINLSKVETFGKGAFYAAKGLTSLSLSSAKTIGDFAFLAASAVKTIDMPNVNYIGKQAFSGLDITTVDIPSTISYIGETAFYNNVKLASFTNFGMITSEVNDYCLIDNGVLYVKMNNGKYALNCYPSSKTDVDFVMKDDATYIQMYAVSNVRNLTRVTLSNALVKIGIGAFSGSNNLNKVTFRSTNAPALEAMNVVDNQNELPVLSYDEQLTTTILNSSISYDTSSEIYKILTAYLNFNGDIKLGYNQFVGYVGTVSRLSVAVPSNYVASTYSSIPYIIYFDFDKVNTTEVGETLNRNSLNYIDTVNSLPENITLKDKDAILNGRTYYNALNQDLTKFGYSSADVTDLALKLEDAYNTYYDLKSEQVSKTYDYLVDDINNLGSFSISKLDEYLAILRNVNKIDQEDRQYLDTSKLDAFQAQFKAYTDALNSKIENSAAVNKIGNVAVAVTASIVALVSAAGVALIVTKKKGGAAL